MLDMNELVTLKQGRLYVRGLLEAMEIDPGAIGVTPQGITAAVRHGRLQYADTEKKLVKRADFSGYATDLARIGVEQWLIEAECESDFPKEGVEWLVKWFEKHGEEMFAPIELEILLPRVKGLVSK